MSFENSAGLGVANHYGARKVGGTEGVVKTAGVVQEFMEDLDSERIGYGFPVVNGQAYVTEVDTTLLGGSVSAITIGGVDVTAATPEAPVQIPDGNSGVIAYTGGDGTGKALIKFKKYSLV